MQKVVLRSPADVIEVSVYTKTACLSVDRKDVSDLWLCEIPVPPRFRSPAELMVRLIISAFMRTHVETVMTCYVPVLEFSH